jgi:glycine cleavage system H protein
LKDEGSGRFRLGLTYRYQEQIKSLVYLELPRVGDKLKRGEPFGALESSKVSTDLTSPLDSTVVAVNAAVIVKPELVNRDPYGEGWLVLVETTELGTLPTLLSADEYLSTVNGFGAG